MGTIKMKGLLRGLRYISIIFDEEKEPELEIGFPTDVRHVAHIGWDGPSVDTLSWLTNFERPNGGFQSAPLPITSGEPHESPEVRWVSEDATNPGREPINSSGKVNSDRRRGSGENSESGNHRRRSAEHSESRKGGGGRRHPKDSSSSSSSSSNNRQIQERSLDGGGGGSESNSGNLPDGRRSKKKIRRKKSKEVSNNESGSTATTRSSKLRNSNNNNNNTPDASPSRLSRFADEVANDDSPSTRGGLLTSSKNTVPSNLSDPEHEFDSDAETETGSVAASERQ